MARPGRPHGAPTALGGFLDALATQTAKPIAQEGKDTCTQKNIFHAGGGAPHSAFEATPHGAQALPPRYGPGMFTVSRARLYNSPTANLRVTRPVA